MVLLFTGHLRWTDWMTNYIRRRECIAIVGGAGAVWPLAARAQQPAMPVVGYLYAGTPEGGAKEAAAFRKALGEAGYVDGSNVRIEYRWGENDNARMPELAADLVRRGVTVITAIAGAASRAATMKIQEFFCRSWMTLWCAMSMRSARRSCLESLKRMPPGFRAQASTRNRLPTWRLSSAVKKRRSVQLSQGKSS